jgi:hypothetical protein
VNGHSVEGHENDILQTACTLGVPVLELQELSRSLFAGGQIMQDGDQHTIIKR